MVLYSRDTVEGEKIMKKKTDRKATTADQRTLSQAGRGASHGKRFCKLPVKSLDTLSHWI